jgi:phosphatidylserine/phosphatidylglycerophosphate/cardiolipin synthase-like enzyme
MTLEKALGLPVLAQPGFRTRQAAKTPDAPAARGAVELVSDGQHFTRIVREGILRAETSVDILTADFKAMLIPDAGPGRRGRRARSIVEVFRGLAEKGVEIRLLHAGTPSSAALRELRKSLPNNLTIRRCPRLHAKTVIIDSRGMYLGSANLTGAGLGAKADGRRNFEMGIWTESPALIDGVLEQFNALWEGRQCKTCKRKDICPVPLEEPEL